MKKGRRVFLVGFMGSGKTTVGECLARELGFRFIDLDREIERERGLPIAAIFARQGEEEFRRLEAAALQAIASLGDVVVATGGGILLRPENRKFIRDNGTSVWLDAPLDTMIERCGSGGVRPLLGDRDRMAALLAERIEAYRGADLRADGAGGSPDRIARVIASRLGRVE